MQITIDGKNNKPARINYREWHKILTQCRNLETFRNKSFAFGCDLLKSTIFLQ